jgi:hypothetical protein
MARTFGWRVVVGGLLVLACTVVVPVVSSVEPAGAATAITLYVSPGSTGTTCTISDQCGLVSTAASVATSGSYIGDDVTIQVAAGTYGGSRSRDAPNFDASSLHSLVIVGAGASSTTVDGGLAGGAVFTILNGTVVITGLTITDGFGGIKGGGIYIAAGTVTIENDTISNDVASGSGGGIYDASAGTVTVENDTLTNTRADGGFGGGIYTNAGQINIFNDTLNAGQATGGGAVEVDVTASASLVDDTLANGSAYPNFGDGVGVQQEGFATITSSILDDSGCFVSTFGSGGLANGGYNVETGPDSCGFDTNPTNVVLPPLSYVPGLADSLAANGSSGPETFGLAPGNSPTSPAFELVPTSVCTIVTDERGSPRPGTPGQNCDAGAYEFDPTTDVAITTASLPNGSVYSKTNKVTYSAALQAAGGNPPYKWSLPNANHLPPGLRLGKKSGVIFGRATQDGTYYFTVEVIDKRTRGKSQSFATADLFITIGS